ncbi:MAG: hypothetical protein C6P35_04425 [Cohnella sp.]|nr:MAG: hypothetical protein C6P35_04425 [Cohnella sp.]
MGEQGGVFFWPFSFFFLLIYLVLIGVARTECAPTGPLPERERAPRPRRPRGSGGFGRKKRQGRTREGPAQSPGGQASACLAASAFERGRSDSLGQLRFE